MELHNELEGYSAVQVAEQQKVLAKTDVSLVCPYSNPPQTLGVARV